VCPRGQSFRLGSAPDALGVTPAPNGGYPGGNTAEGQSALLSLTSGGYNTAVGYFSLRSDNTGDQNTATGAGSLLSNTTGSDNTANGFLALLSNTTGTFNTANGEQALVNNTTGNNNVALGYTAGSNVTTANNVIFIGAGVSGENLDNVIYIGAGMSGEGMTNACYIGQIFGQTSFGGTAVFIDADGRLGTVTSSRRFKEEIKPMDRASEALYALKPVTFRYKKGIDPQGIPQFGLVAEEVEKVSSDLVVRDKEGKPYTVRYDAVNAMLLNEFLKDHKRVEAQQANIAELQSTVALQQKGTEVLAAQLKEQAAQIQNVSGQIETIRPLNRVVLSNP